MSLNPEVPPDPLSTEPKKVPTEEWNFVINNCYERFCLPHARDKAAMESSHKLHNVLVHLHKFSTVIEGHRAMRDGDIGRLMNIWRIRLIMTQSLKGLTHYSVYIPRLVLLLTKILYSRSHSASYYVIIFCSHQVGVQNIL